MSNFSGSHQIDAPLLFMLRRGCTSLNMLSCVSAVKFLEICKIVVFFLSTDVTLMPMSFFGDQEQDFVIVIQCCRCRINMCLIVMVTDFLMSIAVGACGSGPASPFVF